MGNINSSATILPTEAVQGSVDGITHYYVVPLLRVMVFLCLAMVIMTMVEKVYLAVVVACLKLFRRKPEKQYKWEDMKKDDLEIGDSAYPMVLVQLPMCNEKKVYQLSIGAACNLSWPADRIIIQVLDDSNDPSVRALVQEECRRWASKGVNIKCENREHRKGYKAGALKDGINHSYVKLCEYVVIFDADFQPDPDFLYRTIPYLIHNPNLALVQASWTFVNSDECMLTRMQEMSMDYHFTVEQEVGSAVHAFFGFNGVWRIAALNDAGGWKERTTVEDMDLGCRAALKAWKFLFLGDVKVKNELPSSFKAYRYQQHRWSCGPANLFKKMTIEIITNKKVSIWKKVYLIYAFFFVNKIVAHIVPFTFFCLVLPATVLVPQVNVPIWGAFYLPLAVAILNVLPSPRSFHLVVLWMLFENVMSLHRTIATFIGLLEVGRVNEWVITEKLGNAFNTKTGSKAVNKLPRFSIGERLHVLEIIVGLYLVFCGWYNFCYGNNHYYVYLFVQGVSFFVIGFGYIGAFGTTS
ncbi:glucomannan 4-beta-mannosyltransferase 9-like isoform X2 [Ipomoea triloba]|uniref:glucomannan 4-beta-mannosyltransferase 9-like isoform X2 n=1 Tax=Ipomoea triloba TaxID=35885 RepID=UPI00125E5D18|nr:glucomannan 4-beta-mannosyltransferase 9-like isoform X2 [Ipomoea triloba]